jgi:stress response protein SCP2
VLGDFVRSTNRRVTLIALLFAVSAQSNLHNITFDLQWNYPARSEDYLDAACFVFDSDYVYKDVLFYGKKEADPSVCASDVMRHSGDLMDHVHRTGHHYITMDLRRMPANISTLFLTLSAYNSPTVSSYLPITITLRDTQAPTQELTPPWQPHIAASQSVIMCALVREGEGGWGIVPIGEGAPGTAHDLFSKLISELERRPRIVL